jgi:hypothetical protein
MRAEIELYKGLTHSYYGSLAISPLLIEALHEEIVEIALAASGPGKLQRFRAVLTFADEADLDESKWPRPLSALRDSLGWVHVQYLVNLDLLYDRRLGMGTLLRPAIAAKLERLDPGERDWAVAFRNITDGASTRPVPDVLGSVEVDLAADSRPLPFTIQPVETPAAEALDPDALGIDRTALGPVNVLLPVGLRELLLKELPLSSRMEEGGFFLGRIRPAADQPDCHLAEVTHVMPAASAGASAIHFTFTPDSFHDVNKLLGERGKGEELVGWYHTHLFSPSADGGAVSGLSGTDIDTHLTTFRREGQVAGLINLFDRRRMLRFYCKVGKTLEECPVWIADERGRYHTASPNLGRR